MIFFTFPTWRNSAILDINGSTSTSVPIGDLVVAFCTHFIFRKSHERTALNAEKNFFTESKTELGAFFYPHAQYEG